MSLYQRLQHEDSKREFWRVSDNQLIYIRSQLLLESGSANKRGSVVQYKRQGILSGQVYHPENTNAIDTDAIALDHFFQNKDCVEADRERFDRKRANAIHRNVPSRRP